MGDLNANPPSVGIPTISGSRRKHYIDHQYLQPTLPLSQNYFQRRSKTSATSGGRVSKNRKYTKKKLLEPLMQIENLDVIEDCSNLENGETRYSTCLHLNESLAQVVSAHQRESITSATQFEYKYFKTALQQLQYGRKSSVDFTTECITKQTISTHRTRRKSESEINFLKLIKVLDRSNAMRSTYKTSGRKIYEKSKKCHELTLKGVLKSYDDSVSSKSLSTNCIKQLTPRSSVLSAVRYKKQTFETKHVCSNIESNSLASSCRSLREIILTTKDIGYNGCELSDPINLMSSAFVVSLPSCSGNVHFRKTDK